MKTISHYWFVTLPGGHCMHSGWEKRRAMRALRWLEAEGCPGVLVKRTRRECVQWCLGGGRLVRLSREREDLLPRSAMWVGRR